MKKLDLAVDKDANDMCVRVGLETSNIMSMDGRMERVGDGRENKK